MEQLVAAEQHDLLRHEAKAGAEPAGGEVQPGRFSTPAAWSSRGAWRCRRLAKHLLQSFGLGLGLTDDEHVLPGGGRFQLFAHARNVAAEALDRLERQMTGC